MPSLHIIFFGAVSKVTSRVVRRGSSFVVTYPQSNDDFSHRTLFTVHSSIGFRGAPLRLPVAVHWFHCHLQPVAITSFLPFEPYLNLKYSFWISWFFFLVESVNYRFASFKDRLKTFSFFHSIRYRSQTVDPGPSGALDLLDGPRIFLSRHRNRQTTVGPRRRYMRDGPRGVSEQGPAVPGWHPMGTFGNPTKR